MKSGKQSRLFGMNQVRRHVARALNECQAPFRLYCLQLPNSFSICEVVHYHLRFADIEHGYRRAQAMTSQPAKRIPQWLTMDLLVIILSLAIISIFIAIVD